MNLRRIAILGTLVASTLASFNAFRGSGDNASPPANKTLRVSEPICDPRAPRNLNQQWAGWTFGRMIGVSIGPEHAPPPTVYVWK